MYVMDGVTKKQSSVHSLEIKIKLQISSGAYLQRWGTPWTGEQSIAEKGGMN